jgi:carbon-monoxide dehydrogenase small subunit
MLIAARDLVRRKSGLTRQQVRTEMSGNLCRCTGYMGIVSAIERVMASKLIPAQAGAQSTWLGPAPGPVATTAEAPAAVARPTAILPREAARSERPRVRAEPIRVTVGAIEEVGGEARLTQSFVLPHPRDSVWRLMSDPIAVARSMPGMSLDGPPQDGKASGRLEVRIGPIAASFAGEGTIEQFPSDYCQVIEGRGSDRRSGSRASGKVDYRLQPVGGDATRVDVAMSYVLTGPLAQIGRSGIVRDLVRRIGEAFAQNLDAQLRDPGAALRPAQLHGLSLLTHVLLDRIRALFATMLGRRGQ